MKKCSNCGAQLPDDELFCPRCGEEVQLVPIFETVESSIKEQQRILEEKERERQAIMKLEEEERARAAKKRNTILISTGVLALIVVSFFSLSFILKTSRKSAFNSRYTKAVEAYNNGEYDSSLDLITVALEKDPGNLEGKILMADIYAAQGKTDMAATIYLEAVNSDPDSESAYKKLIGMYEALGQGDNIHTLLSSCKSQAILDKFSDYICEPPVFSLAEGTYETAQNLEITDENGNEIRYTMDGNDPSRMSLSYSTVIGLTGGTIKVRAVCYNAKGVPSDVAEATYVIEADYLDAPVIFPRATSFTLDDGKTHAFTVIVPRGTRALYSFDTMPTAESPAYTGPVDMLEGNHAFYAVLVDKKSGVISTPSSVTYTLSASDAQQPISVVQDADGNISASYSNGEAYVPPTPAYVPDSTGGNTGGWTPADSGNGGNTGGYEPAPAPDSGTGGGYNPAPAPDPGTGGGENPAPDPGTGGGEEPTPDPGTGGGEEPTPDPGTGGGEEPTPDPGTGGEEPAPDPGTGGGEEPAPDPGDGGDAVTDANDE